MLLEGCSWVWALLPLLPLPVLLWPGGALCGGGCCFHPCLHPAHMPHLRALHHL